MTEEPNPASEMLVSAPISTDSAGAGGHAAVKSVVRVVSPQTGLAGTGFLHKSGYVITAEHVVRGAAEMVLLPASGDSITAPVLALDVDLDLALLSPKSGLGAAELRRGRPCRRDSHHTRPARRRRATRSKSPA